MNVVDSSGWLEYFIDGENADIFEPVIQNVTQLLVPTVCLYEVFKQILRRADEAKALEAIGLMMQGQVIDIDASLAVSAAKISTTLKIPMADSMILAAARAHQAILWTQDSDFENLPDVQFFAKS